ncbi:MAG: hypothetical protein K2G36_07240, partial [Ruminococcus sp.]|nr:hypothetical protein [Ruminococcus sp.]
MLLEKLIGAEITGINHIYDYWQILTDKGTVNIYGNVNSEIFDYVINCQIIKIKYSNENYLYIYLSNNKIIMIFLDSPDNIPEYFSIYLDTGA